MERSSCYKASSDRQTDRQTDMQTDRQTDGYPVAELFSTVLKTMGLAPINLLAQQDNTETKNYSRSEQLRWRLMRSHRYPYNINRSEQLTCQGLFTVHDNYVSLGPARNSIVIIISFPLTLLLLLVCTDTPFPMLCKN